MKLRELNTIGLSKALGYDQPEKLYRLFREENARPSLDIITDISNIFDDLNTHWLLTGKGEMMLGQGINTTSIQPFKADNPEFQALAGRLKGKNAGQSASPTASPSAKNSKKAASYSAENSGKTPHFLAEPGSVYNLGAPRIVTVNERKEENIIYVPVRARAGYLTGYGDPEFIETLPTLRLPGLDNATYRMFEVEGPSMAPNIISGDRVIGEWVDNLQNIRENRVHVVVTRKDGIVVKRLQNRIDQRGKIVLKSDTINHRKEYPTTQIDPDDILELWYCRLKLSADFAEPAEVYHRLADLESDMVEVKQILSSLIK